MLVYRSQIKKIRLGCAKEGRYVLPFDICILRTTKQKGTWICGEIAIVALLLYDEILQKDTVLRCPLSLRTGIFFAAQLYRTWTRSIFLQPKSTWQMKFDTFILCSIASLIPPYSRPAERGKRIQRVSQLPDISAKNMHSLARGSRGGSNS